MRYILPHLVLNNYGPLRLINCLIVQLHFTKNSIRLFYVSGLYLSSYLPVLNNIGFNKKRSFGIKQRHFFWKVTILYRTIWGNLRTSRYTNFLKALSGDLTVCGLYICHVIVRFWKKRRRMESNKDSSFGLFIITYKSFNLFNSTRYFTINNVLVSNWMLILVHKTPHNKKKILISEKKNTHSLFIWSIANNRS